jgi:nanoRNase/pAp phosphatase (c-di-AMP/oligoRNAs hydrolase)
MDQLEEAARLLHECILQNRKIRIIGDYDADGILSVYILYASLRQAGADVSYDIPDRFADGFGMSMRLVEKAHHDGINTIITCDNGIAQNAEISCAKQLGMTVILTDHHEPNFRILPSGEKEYLLPEADVIVDPGFGFGKTQQQNYAILAQLSVLEHLHAPILVGLSRKSMLYQALQTTPEEVLPATVAANTIALQHGANILRVHDVKAAKQAIEIYQLTR